MRAILKKNFLDFLKKENPDILCLQEIKISEAARDKEGLQSDARKNSADDKIIFPGYDVYWNSAERPGYSGTAILVKNNQEECLKVVSARNGIGQDFFDKEGRAQILEFENFFLVNAYFPNANHELSRLRYKIDFNQALYQFLKKLKKKKAIIVTGDFNVAHQEIDLARPKENVGNPGFTSEERVSMTEFLDLGFIDTYRHFYPAKQEYTWWSYRAGARKNNIGWRIDYFCVSDKMITDVKKAFIKPEIMGSDHCPVGIILS